MKFNTIVVAAAAVITISAFISCSKTNNTPAQEATASQSSLQDKMYENGTNPDEAVIAKPESGNTLNHFYIESNKRNKNTILVFTQQQNGQLILQDEVASGGYGSGEALGSQGALAVSKESNLLFAVNPGSNSVSSFRINANTGGIQLLFTANTNGQLPNSITVYGNKLFVLNTLNSSVSGYTFTPNGFLTPIKDATHSLSAMNADAPEIKFQPDGAAVYVTEKKTNIIDKFTLNSKGAITSAMYIQSRGVEPFGFDYGRNNQYLIVANAANGFSGAGSATSYQFSSSLGLKDVNGAVSDFESAPCWVATTAYGSFAFVTNTVSNNISSYYIAKNGALMLINAVAAADGKAPIDITVSNDNKYVLAIYSGSHSLVAYERKNSGVISLTDKVTALPEFAAGLAAY